MSLFRLIEPPQADASTRDKLEAIQHKLGRLPNIFKAMANSPAALVAYQGMDEALANGRLSTRLREQVALVVSEQNGCLYCLAAHSAMSKRLGLSEDEIENNRRAESDDPTTQAALTFAASLVNKRGQVSEAEVDQLRQAGFDDGQIAELLATTVHTIFTNYFNLTAGTPIDFPKVEALTTV
jgi:uncharacterized peroxidase-related enzyme